MHQEMLEAFTKGGDPRISVAFENMVKIWYLYIKLFNVIKTNLLYIQILKNGELNGF